MRFYNQSKYLAWKKSARIVSWILDEINRKRTINQQVQNYLKSSISYSFTPSKENTMELEKNAKTNKIKNSIINKILE